VVDRQLYQAQLPQGLTFGAEELTVHGGALIADPALLPCNAVALVVGMAALDERLADAVMPFGGYC
jgi:hypothetical protein